MGRRNSTARVRETRRRVPAPGFALIAAVVLAAAACQAGIQSTTSPTAPPDVPGRSSETPTARPPVATASVPASTPISFADPRSDGLEVTFGEFAITLEAAVIRPGPVTLVVRNAGALTHGLEMKLRRSGPGSGSGSGPGSGRDREKIETRTFRSGETLRVEAALAPGVYEVVCYVADHEDRGMHARLEVRTDAPLVAVDPADPPAGRIHIVQFAFVPATLEVGIGARVTWANEDAAPHTITQIESAFDSRQLDPGGTFSSAFDVAGSFTYKCEIHPTMVGTVVVR